MSWLNNSLNTIKGQLSTLAHEILEETAGPGDAEYHGPEIVNSRTAVEMLADTQRDKEELDKLCSEKEIEIVALRKQIEILQNQISDPIAGGSRASAGSAGGSAGAIGSGRTSKTPTDNNASASALEDSWCWEPDNVKTDNDHSSETSSSGNGNEIVNITLEEIPLGATAKATNKTKIHRLGGAGPAGTSADLQKRLQQLEEENKQLSSSLEELDTQHNVAMQNMLELKTDLQDKLSKVSKDYDAFKKSQEDKFIHYELEMAKLKKQNESLDNEKHEANKDNEDLKEKLNASSDEIKKALEEMTDLQSLLEKKTLDNKELIERIKETQEEALKGKNDLTEKIDVLTKEVDELKSSKTKKTSESSQGSSGKQSEDEFILVREQDAQLSAANTPPPTKEELKDRIVALENRLSELTLENGSLSLKLRDRDMEKELALKVLKENIQILQTENDEINEKLRMTLIEMEDQQFKINDLKEKASEAIIAQEQLKVLNEDKLKIADEVAKLKESFKTSLELERRLILSEKEKEALQLELQSLKVELEQKIQKLTYENQHLTLNAEAETETLNNNNELEQKLKDVTNETAKLKLEIERLGAIGATTDTKKRCVTDLDDDDNEDENFSLDRLKNLLKQYSGNDDDSKDINLLEESEKIYKNLNEKLSKIDTLQRELDRVSSEVMELQDGKLVWDHEKKTLEADISQYILQCDELMKNNEILLNELENYKRNKLETIPENNEENIVQLETQLDECSKMNRTLEREYMELSEQQEDLEKDNHYLSEKLRQAQQQLEVRSVKEKDLRLQIETLELEKCNLLLKLNEIDSSNENKETQTDLLRKYQDKSESLEKQLSTLTKDHADLVNAMQKQKEVLVETIRVNEDHETHARAREMAVKRQKVDYIKEKEKDEKERNQLREEMERLRQEVLAKDIVSDSLRDEIKVLQSYVTGAESLMEEKTLMEEKLMEKTQAIEELKDEIVNLKKSEKELQEELQINKLKTEENEKATASSTDSNNHVHLARIAELEEKLLATADLQKSLDTLNYEKQEMIKALQQKHAENMHYYMQIQMLTPLAQQQQQAAAEEEIEKEKPCEKCPTLEMELASLRKDHEKFQDQINFLKEKSDILTTNLMTEQTNQKLVREEKADVMEQNANLRKDVERLRAHLLEIEDMHTQESVEMQKELEETKSRMLSLEDEVSKSSKTYTSASIRANQHAETLQAQYAVLIQQRDELLQKLSLAEDRESKNQAALTNLQCALEQFQNDKENDIKLATQRIRKELQQHLDKEAQLQLEIQQLQQQLADATQGLNAASRLTDQLESCQRTINVLREEVEALKQQNAMLEQKLSSNESSQSDKIEKTLIKSLLIGYVVSSSPNDKQQVLRMISSVLDFNQSETDKVGLNKQQGGWLGSLLGGGGGSGGATGSHSKDNLVQAFVQFLEQESQPQSQQQMPNLLNITHSTPTHHPSPSTSQHLPTVAGTSSSGSRRSSNISISSLASTSNAAPNSNAAAPSTPTPVPIQPLLLNSTVLDDFAPSRNSSSILKDILNDS